MERPTPSDQDQPTLAGRSQTPDRGDVGDPICTQFGGKERSAAQPKSCRELVTGEPIIVDGVRAEFLQPWNDFDFVAVVRYPGGVFWREHISKIGRDVTRWIDQT